MKHKTPTSIFPSADTEAERVAESVYYAEPYPQDALATIPKTAPIIEKALQAAYIRGLKTAIETVEGLKIDPGFSSHWQNGFAWAKASAHDAISVLIPSNGKQDNRSE